MKTHLVGKVAHVHELPHCRLIQSLLHELADVLALHVLFVELEFFRTVLAISSSRTLVRSVLADGLP